MTRNGCVLSLRMCVLLSVAVGLTMMGGCPPGPGPEPAQLTVSTSSSGEPTVGKTIELQASVTGGTAPYNVQWTQVDGPDVDLLNAATETASFVPSTAGFYTFVAEASDSSSTPRTGSSDATIPVGDIRFEVADWSSFLVVAGNPAVLRTDERADAVRVDTTVTVFDPEFTTQNGLVLADGVVDPHNTTQMQATYRLVSVPADAREQDVTFARAADSLWDNTDNPGNRITIQANPDSSFQVLTNIATTVENLGEIVPGDYVFRATITNPNGLSRTRDLLVTVLVEDISASSLWGNSVYGFSIAAGPAAVQVKTLPMGSPGPVTDKVMQPTDTADMTVTVFPSSDTVYHFYVVDGNLVTHPEFITQSADSITADGATHDISLTFGLAAGLPTGTYMLHFQTMDSFGSLSLPTPVMVNATAAPGTPVRFHVTDDYLTQTALNAALVGATSNNVDTPTTYEGWSGSPESTLVDYGFSSALADVNLDGALDILTLDTSTVRIKTDGFVQGSTEALRHPENAGNFGPQLGDPDHFTFTQGLARDRAQIAVGDLNGDGLADVAVSERVPGAPPTDGYVRVFFHTGDPAQPYSEHGDQTLQIYPPTYEHRFRGPDGDLTSVPAVGADPGEPAKDRFGLQIAIAPVFGGDTQPDLIITDPGFASMAVYGVAAAGTPAPAVLANAFYNGNQGRVYVFAGGASGELQPGRPDIVTSEILDVGVTDITPAVASVDALTESNIKYAAVYTGNRFDQIGYSLAADAKGIAVGSPLAIATGHPFTTHTIAIIDAAPARVADPTMVVTAFGGVIRTYEFDTNGVTVPGNVVVDISAANADLPANALATLMGVINADADRLVNATADPVNPDTLIFTAVFTDAAFAGTEALDLAVRLGAFTQNMDGIAYFVTADTASAVLSSPINGTQNSNMGLGAVIAEGDINGDGNDDLLIAALDAGDGLGVHDANAFLEESVDDGAVFFVFGGTTTLVPITGVGADTALAPAASTIDQTAVGASLGVFDVNGDSRAEAFFTEPGFDHVYLIMGAATPATTPNITFTGVTFDDDTPTVPEGGSLPDQGTFLFGDITGDAELDWLFLEPNVNFGFAGFAR